MYKTLVRNKAVVISFKMSKARVFVIGASGNCGKPTVLALSKKYGETLDIIAGVRKPENVPEFKSLQGVTIVRAEMGKREKLVGIFKDVNVLFIIPPRSYIRAEIACETAEAAKLAGVKHIIVVSTAVAVGPDKIIGKQFHDIEVGISNLGPDYTILCVPYFMENFGYFRETIQKSSVFYEAIEPSKRFPVICVEDVAEVASVIMFSPKKHAGKTYNMVSDRCCYNDMLKVLRKVTGRDIKFIQQSYEEARAALFQLGLPEWNVDGGLEFTKEANAGEHETGDDDDIKTITGEEPTNMEAWFQRHASMFK